MAADWPHTFADGEGNTASGEQVMENLNYVYDFAEESGGGAVVGGPGTSLPGSPSNGDEYMYLPDGTSGPIWHMRWHGASNKWLCKGQAPVVKEVTAAVATTSTSYAALTASAGPSFAIPKSGLYIVEIGAVVTDVLGELGGIMSYDIGGTGAVDADGLPTGFGGPGQVKRPKTLGAVTLTAKYKTPTSGGGDTPGATFARRTLSITPVYFG